MPTADQQDIPRGLHRGDLGMQRARIAPLLTGEDLGELLALAEFGVCAGGSLHFGPSPASAVRLKRLRLVEWVPQPEVGRGTRLRRLTKLGWLTLLTRAETEMRHLLPPDEEDEDTVRSCRLCGCTDLDCRGCIERTGEPCYWVERDLCSACESTKAKTPEHSVCEVHVNGVVMATAVVSNSLVLDYGAAGVNPLIPLLRRMADDLEKTEMPYAPLLPSSRRGGPPTG